MPPWTAAAPGSKPMPFARFLHRKRPGARPPGGESPRLLVVQIAGIGDLVLATPALDALRERYPGARLDVVASPRAADLLAGHPSVNTVHSFDILRYRNPASLISPAAAGSLKHELRPLREARYDALLSMNRVATARGGWTLGLLFRALHVPLWVGRNTEGRAPYFDLEVRERDADGVPEALVRLRVAALLGADASPRSANLAVGAEERARAEELLPGAAAWAAVLPGANVADKRWPADRFAEVARHLAGRGLRVLVFAGPGEEECARHVAAAAGEAGLDLTGRITLREAAALLQRMRVVVTNDTGPMHIAAAVGAPVVALFGPTDVRRFRPWAAVERVRLVLPDPFTDPEELPDDPRRRRMEAISTAAVIAAAEDLLESTG